MMLPIMWHAILRECAGACSLRDLRGGAPKRPAPRTDLDYTSSTATDPHQYLPRIREGRHRHRLDAAIRYRSARRSCARTTAMWDCIAYARRRDSDDDRRSRRHRCHRYLEPPFLHDDGGKDACVHGANPPLPRTSNGSCGPIQLSSFGTVRRKHLGTSSLWYATAVT